MPILRNIFAYNEKRISVARILIACNYTKATRSKKNFEKEMNQKVYRPLTFKMQHKDDNFFKVAVRLVTHTSQENTLQYLTCYHIQYLPTSIKLGRI